MADLRDDEPRGGRFEFRVWGPNRDAARLLAKLADSETRERVEDCYLLVDDPNWNAKIRGDSMKIKQLVNERKGFEHWVSDHHRDADSAPSPFDELFEELRLDKLWRASRPDLSKVIKRAASTPGVRAVVVVKDRRRYTVGDMRGEWTKIRLPETGDVLRTLVIEGDDLDALKDLRKRLGLRGEENVAVHAAIASELDR